METKQQHAKQTISQWRNERGNKKIYLETNENRNTTYQNPRGTAKEILRGRFISIPAYFKKQDKSQPNLTSKGMRKKKKKRTKHTFSRRKE